MKEKDVKKTIQEIDVEMVSQVLLRQLTVLHAEIMKLKGQATDMNAELIELKAKLEKLCQ